MLVVLLIGAIGGAVGCVGELVENDPNPVTGADAGGGNNAAARMFFDTNIQSMFSATRPKGACTLCHQNTVIGDGPDFLGTSAAENYTTLANDARLVTSSPATSVLLLRGDHLGDAFCTGIGTPYAACASDEVSLITQWINLEAGN